MSFAVGAILFRTREWSCKYRFWSDGGSNSKPKVANALVLGGIGLGIVVAAVGVRRYYRTRRGVDLLAAAIGLIPLIVGVAIVLVVPHGSWFYDCSTG